MSREGISIRTALAVLSTYRLREELRFLDGFVNPSPSVVRLSAKIRAEINARARRTRRAREEGDHYAKPWPVRS